MIVPATLTPEERRWLMLSTISAILGALAAEGIRHGFEELRRVQGERREAADERSRGEKAAQDESKARRASIEAP